VRQLADGARFEAVAFSPDGRLVAAGAKEGEVRLIDVASGQTVRALKEHANAAYRSSLIYRDGRTVAFSPDGRMVAWGSWQVVQVWEVATGQERLAFEAHRGEVMSVAFFPDGRRLATGSPDTTALVWDLASCAFDGSGPPAKVKEDEWAGLWADLSGDDGHKAYRALWRAAAVPDEALPRLRSRVKAVPAPDRDRLARLVKDLDAEEFAVREKATDELAKLGGAAEAALRAALAGQPSAEVKQRVGSLLDKLRSAGPEKVRDSRAVELLEHLGTAEAKDFLKELAGGAGGAWLTEEAKAAVRRQELRGAADR
jgi:hypothetical protein